MVIVTDTQKKIIDAFFQVIQEFPDQKKITLKMVAERAGIKRQNIYKKHFNSVNDIIRTIHVLVDKECEEKLNSFVKTGNGDPILYFAKEILPILYEKRDWLKILYGSVIDSEWTKFLTDKYTPIIRLWFEKTEHNSNLPVDFQCSLIVREILAVVATWLVNEKPEPASLFQKKFIYILHHSTYELIV